MIKKPMYRAWHAPTALLQSVMGIYLGAVPYAWLGTESSQVRYGLNELDLMQWTGAADKAGVPIFENDILAVNSMYDQVVSGTVMYCDDRCAWIVCFDDGNEPYTLDEFMNISALVIGNIYQNDESDSATV